MAKRGRKKKSKLTQLSTADKGHLKRILGKVRQIKANKAAAAPVGGPSQSAIDAAQRQIDQANQAVIAFTSRGLNLSLGTNQNTLKILNQAVSDAIARLQALYTNA